MKFFKLLFVFILFSLTILSKPLKVGLILSMGGLGDKSFNDSAYAGLMRAQKDFNIKVKYVEPASWMEDSFYLEQFSENNFDLVIAVSYTASDAIKNTAANFPNIKYAIVDTIVPGKNIASLVFNETEGSFLVGALAAKVTKTNKLGFVGATDIPLINRFKNGYEQGAKYINPNIEILSTYIGGDAPYNDAVKGKEHTLSLANQGVDIIYHAAGNSGIGVFQGVKEKNIYGIGVDCNQDNIIKGKILTSMLKNVDVAIYTIIKDTLENRFQGKTYIFDLTNNGIGTTQFEFTKDIIGEKNIKDLEKIKNDIITKKIKIKNDQ